MKKKSKLLPALLVTVFLLGGIFILYVTLGEYYRGSFYPGTYANGIYCTGRSVEEVNTELKSMYQPGSLTLKNSFGFNEEIALSDIGFEVDYKSQLNALQNPTNPLLWLGVVKDASHHTLNPGVSFDEALLREAVLATGIAEIAATDDPEASQVEIRRELSYVLIDGTKNRLDRERVFEKVKEALLTEQFTVDFSDCYVDMPYTEEQQETLALWEKVDDFQNCGIVYDMGDEEIPLTPAIVADWITLHADGSFALDKAGELIPDEEKMTAFIDGLCGEYDTLDSTRTFLSTRGDIITIDGGTYGNKLDRDAELAYLKEAFLKDISEVHIPAYEKEAYTRGKNDIGDTYVEIDMTEQKLYFYDEGELRFESAIVTGNTSRRMGTPEGVNFVYSMQRNRTLRGPGYASPVKYWVPVVGNIGIHDANWRNKFGGEIYKKNGSHGCINVPPEKMGELYDMLEIGVPVVMFY